MRLVQEAYKEYEPPTWVRPTVEGLLASVPAAYLSKVQAIVLTDAASQNLGKTQRMRGRKFDRRASRGFYHRADIVVFLVAQPGTVASIAAWTNSVSRSTYWSLAGRAIMNAPGGRHHR
jgi:hypothetical protein